VHRSSKLARDAALGQRDVVIVADARSDYPGLRDAPVAAADRLATRGRPTRTRAIVIGLVDAMGFDGIDAGPLDDSWRQQPGTPAHCTDLPADDLRRAVAAADRDRAPHLRDLAMQRVGQLGPNATSDDLIAMSRRLHDAT
jgi:hypothetical protein